LNRVITQHILGSSLKNWLFPHPLITPARSEQPEHSKESGPPSCCGRRVAEWPRRRAMGRRQCELEGCSKRAESGGTPYCKVHGGGKRCQEKGCTKSAAGGGTPCCVAHGGGKRCQEKGCTKSAVGDTGHCRAERTGAASGAKRRTAPRQLLEAAHRAVWRMAGANGVKRRAAPRGLFGDTGHCKAHGGGKRCQHEGCPKSAVGGDTLHCIAHGQAVPARGLHQVSRSSSRQHALHALSAGHLAAARRCGGAISLSTRPGTQLA
jgi:hypothetical protein